MREWEYDALNRLSAYVRSKQTVKLPVDLASVTEANVSEKYKYLADKYADKIKHYFDNDENCEHTNNGVRKHLIDHTFLQPDVDRIAESYGAKIRELTTFRLQETDRKSDRGNVAPTDEGWISELWHTDNDRPGQFKIIVYLSDVTEDRAPFEYKVPVEYIPYISGHVVNDNRIAYKGDGRKVTGPPGTTLIFKNNIVHKGNYCRDGYRDVIMIGLEFHGSVTRVGNVFKKIWKQRLGAR